MDQLDIANRVAKIRKGIGFTQKEISDFLEVDQSLISKCENGERSFSLGMLEKLSDLFGCDLECFINNNTEIQPVAMAFRAQEKTNDDLKTIAVINRIAKNLSFMDRLMEEWEIEGQ